MFFLATNFSFGGSLYKHVKRTLRLDVCILFLSSLLMFVSAPGFSVVTTGSFYMQVFVSVLLF